MKPDAPVMRIYVQHGTEEGASGDVRSGSNDDGDKTDLGAESRSVGRHDGNA
jgi:hypothetical protein